MSENESSQESKPETIIYSQPKCEWCIKTKKFFDDHNIKYTDINVKENDEARNEMFEKSGQFGVPVTIHKGEVIVGFDEPKFKKVFNIA